jgi:NTE family protein
MENKHGLVINGGGVLGIAAVGALSELERVNLYDNFDEFAGASVGALIVTAIALKAPFKYIKTMVSSLDFRKFFDDTPYDFGFWDTRRFLKKYGWFKGDELYTFYKRSIKDLTGNEEITFLEAYEKYGTYLTMTAYRVNDKQTVSFNKDTQPHMPIARGLRCSSSYPFILASETISESDMIKYSGGVSNPGCDVMFADGGILNNYPFGLLAERMPTNDILGIHLTPAKDMNPTNPNGKLPKIPSNFIRYGIDMGMAILDSSSKIHITSEYWDETIPVNTFDFSSMDFDITTEQKKKLFESGQTAIQLKFK